MGLLATASVAIDGSKFKAVNNRDKNFTRAKMERRLAQIEESVARYLSQLDTADLQEPSEALVVRTAHLKEKLAKLASGLIHSGDSQTARSSSSSRHESRHCRERHPG
jgi:paraquat-inducible protein B